MHQTESWRSRRVSRAVCACALRLAGIVLAAATAAAAGGCMSYKPTIPPSDAHLGAEQVAPAEEQARILPPVTNTSVRSAA